MEPFSLTKSVLRKWTSRITRCMSLASTSTTIIYGRRSRPATVMSIDSFGSLHCVTQSCRRIKMVCSLYSLQFFTWLSCVCKLYPFQSSSSPFDDRYWLSMYHDFGNLEMFIKPNPLGFVSYFMNYLICRHSWISSSVAWWRRSCQCSTQFWICIQGDNCCF